MDSDEDNDSSTASPEKAPTQNASITGFLFGNINKEGQLETNDVFDEDCKRQLGGLTVLGMGSMVSEIIDNDDSKVDLAPEDGTDGTGDDVDRKLDEAVDYSDITEAAEDLAALATVTPTANINGDDDYDDDEQDEKKVDSNLMPPPSWIPGAQSAPPTADTTTSSSTLSTSSGTQLSPSKRLDTPLAAMLPPEYADKDVREWFPEFRTGEVLRFSRIFRPVHKSTIWRKRKRKRPEEDPAMDEHSHASDKPMLTMQNLSKETSQGEVIKMEPEENDENGLVTVDDSESDLNVSNVSQEDELLPEECMPDDYDLIMRPLQTEDKSSTSAVTESTDSKVAVAEWRYGPAQLWYDMLEVDHAGQHFDYGFKLKTDEDEVKPELDPDVLEPPKFAKVDIPDEAYHMVTQVQWEDDVIFKGDDVKSKVLASQKTHGIRAGWIPSVSCRTVQQFMSTVTGQTSTNQIPSQFNNTSSMLNQEADDDSESWYSIFPIENEALLYGKWENDVIWDAQAMTHIPKPPMMTLDPNDENIILGIPDDRDPEEQKLSTQIQTKKEKDAKKSKILLGKAGLIKDDDEDEEEEEEQVIRVDPFNISNDEYYNAKLATDNALRTSLGSVIQHSNPAVELRQPFFPTHMGPIRLRNFHRPPLKRYSYGTMSTSGPHPVHPLLKQIKRKAKLRESERLASGGGDMFFMRTPEDLTGRDADLILAEYSEEYPPIMMRAGMATKIKNYYKRKPGKDNLPPNFTYGELAYAHMSPFLGNLSPGQCVQAFQNNMFRAPIYKHAMPHTDFLIIRNRQSYHIREVNDIFTVGQMCPLYEVPGPNSKRSNNFIRDFLQVYIYRLFLKSKDDPRRIKMEEIKKAFPSHSESSIRKRLKLCATFKRTGTDSNWWVLKSDFRLPTEEELRAMVSPEQCCGYYSLLAAEQRLKDAGYGEKSLFAPEQDDEEDAQVKMEDEVKVAPWNTSRAYIHAMKGRCLLALTGVADPTGTGEGFSYVKIPNKPNQPRGEEDQPAKKTVTGTDADLRRLPLKDAKNLLRKFGVPEQEIKKLSRWEVIDVVRTMSTEQAKAGQEGAGMGKFARGNRFSLAEHQERYKEECQRIFDLQNRILSSTEVLSTDEESSSGEDSDFEEMGKNIENILSNQKTSTQLSLEREEAERKELQRMMLHNDKDKSNKDNNEDSINEQEKKLIITRTFIDAKGVQYKRTEIVRKQPVIDIYLRIKQTKDPSVIRQFSCLDSNQKEEMKKEKRRIQEQLRRIKRNEQKGGSPYIPPPPPIQVATFRTTPDKKNKRKKVTPFNPKLKCGACGAIGHMRTNKECPLFSSKGGEGAPVEPTPPPKPSKKPIQVAMTLEQEKLEGETDPTMADKDLINVDGTKVKISKSLIQHADNVRRKSLVLKFPKNQLESAKKKRKSTSVIHCDYLKRPVKGSNRRRTDPVVSMSTIFEDILNEMRDLPDAQPFLVPVNERLVPDYYKIIKKPIDLQTLRNNIRNRRYQSRESFLMEVSLLVKNCELYNGPKSVLTQTSRKMLELVLERLAEKEDRMMRLEKAINPLLDDDDLVSFSYLLEAVVEKMKAIEGSWPFHTPVNKKKFQDYYEIIKSPMDVNTVQKNVTTRKYHTIESFLYDAELIYENSKQYNGPDSNLTAIAKKVRDTAVENVQNNEQLIGLEDAIKAAEEAALEAAETDSLMTGELESIDSMSVTHKDDPESKLQNLSREDEFVDIEGDFDFMEGKVEDSTYNVSGVEPLADNSLAQDLQMSPDNSDDDSAKLSSTGSDSECGDTPSGFDNFDYNAMADNVMGNTNPGAELMDQSGLVADENAQDQAYMDDTEAGENFDPTAFFQSFAPNQDYQNAEDSNMDISQPEMNGNQNANIDNDLQISESDDSSIGNRLSSEDSEDDSNPMF